MLSVQEAEAFTRELSSSGEDLSSYDEIEELQDEEAVEKITSVLCARLLQGDPYTQVGSNVLIAVNPYENLKKLNCPIYGEAVALHFWHRGAHLLPPHIFKIGAQSLAHLVKFQQDQTIIISGESGAGKTEAAKHILSFVTSIAMQKKSRPQRRGSIISGGRRAISVTRALLDSNPVLEAFGNAATNHNENSSRFGKLLELNFDGPRVASGRVHVFMLEKNRIVSHAAGESSFHVMKFLFGAPADVGALLSLKAAPLASRRRGYQELRGSERGSIDNNDNDGDEKEKEKEKEEV